MLKTVLQREKKMAWVIYINDSYFYTHDWYQIKLGRVCWKKYISKLYKLKKKKLKFQHGSVWNSDFGMGGAITCMKSIIFKQ